MRVWDFECAELNARSRRRRSLRQQELDVKWNRILLAPAVVGIAFLLYFCTLPFPVEQWYIGLIAVILIVPYLTRRIS